MFINILTKFLSAWSKHQSQNSRIDRIDRKVVRADPFVRQAQELQELRRFGGSEEVEKEQTPEKSKKFKTTLVFEDIKNLALPLSKESSRVIKQILYRLCPRTFQCPVRIEQLKSCLSTHQAWQISQLIPVTTRFPRRDVQSWSKGVAIAWRKHVQKWHQKNIKKYNSQDIRTPIDGLFESQIVAVSA